MKLLKTAVLLYQLLEDTPQPDIIGWSNLTYIVSRGAKHAPKHAALAMSI